jgi:hypothetical protein
MKKNLSAGKKSSVACRQTAEKPALRAQKRLVTQAEREQVEVLLRQKADGKEQQT